MRQIKLFFLVISCILTINYSFKYYKKTQRINCYINCSNYHYLDQASHWEYNEFNIDNGDTIWTDKQCYNDWCICIDECLPGLCCELLN